MPQTLIYDQRNAPLLETSLYDSTQQRSASFMENTPLYEPPLIHGIHHHLVVSGTIPQLDSVFLNILMGHLLLEELN